jgi:DNA-binding CsgD family transcriptional regulator
MHHLLDDPGSGAGTGEQKASPGIIRDKRQWHFIKNRYRMSLKEVQVAILVCRDFDNDRISQALNVKPSTTKTHVRSIYRKTGVSSRLSLLLRFMDDIERAGMVTGPANGTGGLANHVQPLDPSARRGHKNHL